jgi:hypothetical protein
LPQEAGQVFWPAIEPGFMGNRLWSLDGKQEVFWNSIVPALPGSLLVRSIEGRIDLAAIQQA